MIVIGERVNATRKSIGRAIRDRDEHFLAREISGQDEAGAHFIDLNAGTGTGDQEREISDLMWLVDVALRSTEKKLALDSSDPLVLCRTAEHVARRRLVLLNSVNGEAKRLEALLPLAAKHGCSLIALAMDSRGIPSDPEQRLEVCEAILAAGATAGVPAERFFLDPLVLPLCSDVRQGQVTLETLREIKRRFPEAKTTMGVSNVSHGLPKRSLVNQAFLIAALANGLDSAICDPTDGSVRLAMAQGDLVAGRDRHCRKYTRQVRKGEIQ